MNKVITFPKARELSAEAQLCDYEAVSRTRFKELSPLLYGQFEDPGWYYTPGKERLTFTFYGQRIPPEIETACKIYIVKYLYDRRLSGYPPSLSGLRYTLLGPKHFSRYISSLAEIDSDRYNLCVQELNKNTYRTQASVINSLNAFLRWLGNEYLLSTNVELTSSPKLSDLPPIETKIPNRELIQTILRAKWALEEAKIIAEADGTYLRWESDLLSVFTQAFQYGMGLRIGEVLRLPVDPLIQANGEMFFLVWTEKGKEPYARYVPREWREVFQYTVTAIQKASEPYRRRAAELETTGRLSEVVDRLRRYHEERLIEVQRLNKRLDNFLASKRAEAEKKWQLRATVSPTAFYSLAEARDLMPDRIAPSSDTNAFIKKTFEAWGLECIPTPIDAKKNRYHIEGHQIIDFINDQIEFRANYITDSELLEIIHGHQLNRQQSQDSAIVERRILRQGGSCLAYTMKPTQDFDGGRRPPATISVTHARELIKMYAEGGFDSAKYIDIASFAELFPDLFETKMSTRLTPTSMSRENSLAPELRFSPKIPIYTKTREGAQNVIAYSKTMGYVLEQSSIHDYIKAEFYRLNLSIEKDLYEKSKEYLADPNKHSPDKRSSSTHIIIDSKSFKVQQSPSNYLMLRAAADNSGGKALIPQIMSSKAVYYAFKGNDHAEGLFERYNITTEKDLIASFQTQQGRHWKTTSLFRSGANGEVINLWMGRDPAQGAQYDHNTDRERAKKVRKAMMTDHHRYLSAVSERVRLMIENETSEDLIEDFLEQELQVAQHTPTGMCSRPMYLKPCDLNMRCLSGKDGKGCRHYLLDLTDEAQVAKLRGWKDRVEKEVIRLTEAVEQGIAMAQPHLDHTMVGFNNAKLILKTRDEILTNNPKAVGDCQPFRKTGSEPDDCPFQCGE